MPPTNKASTLSVSVCPSVLLDLIHYMSAMQPLVTSTSIFNNFYKS